MWSYYSKHKGICIGIDMEKARKYLSNMWGKVMIDCDEIEVQYKDIVEKTTITHLGSGPIKLLKRLSYFSMNVSSVFNGNM